jgi:signal transduction histidine kinase/chemotaxis methyl-accepting protein methylase
MNAPLEVDPALARLLDTIAQRYGYDLREYQPGSVQRRLTAVLGKVGAATLDELHERLLSDNRLFGQLADHLTVQVSDMFRDPPMLQAVREQIVPQLRHLPVIRIWHAGCANGEEAYSIAVLLEEAGLLDRSVIYATDLSAAAVNRAREGIYAADRLTSFTDNYRRAGGQGDLGRLFTPAYEHVAIDARLRRAMVFFQHDLVADHPLNDMHLVFCRNVLIYFRPALRDRVVAKLFQALLPGGFLGLGSSERLGPRSTSTTFSEVRPGLPIYRYVPRPKGAPLNQPLNLARPEVPGVPATISVTGETPIATVSDTSSALRSLSSSTSLSRMPEDSASNVLLVDDHEENLIALEAVLGDLGCGLVRARSGNEALRSLLKHRFAVMLLDVQMPEMDGYEVARYARDNPHTREVPIIFLTAANQTEAAMLRGYGSGAVDYLLKPFNPSVLRSKVRVFLELASSRQRLAATMRELEQARQEAERASRFKSQFLANMSHELRTPLNAIIGFGELLEDQQSGDLSAQQAEFVRHIVASGKHLVALMNDILDLARIEAGRVEIRRERVATAPLIESARDIVRPLAVKKGIDLVCDLEGPLPDAHLDPVRVKQILYNLLSNGIKFTPAPGQVRLRASADDHHLMLAVQDTGIGIRPDDQARLFQEFERIEPERGPRQEGTGLGLALTKKLIELHGGTIEVDSEPGKGSTFSVRLPLADLSPAGT